MTDSPNETLTAEERAGVEKWLPKFAAAYDAALARAEAADARVRKLTGLLGWDPLAAESRLAEATDCIKGVRGYLHSTNAGSTFNLPGPVAQRARDLIEAFLSGPTPAPAAESEPDTFAALGAREFNRIHTPENPDTIALRECRAESQKRLDATNGMREALESTRADLATARARIAELEDELQDARWDAMGEDL